MRRARSYPEPNSDKASVRLPRVSCRQLKVRIRKGRPRRWYSMNQSGLTLEICKRLGR